MLKNRISIFGDSYRRKIFSDTPRRIKLFSHSDEEYNVGGMTLKKVKCCDCGYVMETAANVSHLICPHCGGKRFNLINVPESPSQTVEPIKVSKLSLFDSNSGDSPYEKKLKEYSGKTLPSDVFQKEFSNSEELLGNGMAYNTDSGIKISDSAYQTEKLFSKLTITITKELDLDPDITEGIRSKEDVLSDLENREALPEKGIVIIRKAHGLMPPFESNFSDSEQDNGEAWLNDSNIIPDLKLEYANNSFGIKQFMDMLRERYDDAPENIMDLLASHNAIRIDGNQITINK